MQSEQPSLNSLDTISETPLACRSYAVDGLLVGGKAEAPAESSVLHAIGGVLLGPELELLVRNGSLRRSSPSSQPRRPPSL